MFEALREKGFTILTRHHAEAILKHDMKSCEAELESGPQNSPAAIPRVASGGAKS